MSTPPPVLCAYRETTIVADNRQAIVEVLPVLIGGEPAPLWTQALYDGVAVIMLPTPNGQAVPHQFRFRLHDVTTVAEAFAALSVQAERGAMEEQQRMRKALIGRQ